MLVICSLPLSSLSSLSFFSCSQLNSLLTSLPLICAISKNAFSVCGATRALCACCACLQHDPYRRDTDDVFQGAYFLCSLMSPKFCRETGLVLALFLSACVCSVRSIDSSPNTNDLHCCSCHPTQPPTFFAIVIFDAHETFASRLCWGGKRK